MLRFGDGICGNVSSMMTTTMPMTAIELWMLLPLDGACAPLEAFDSQVIRIVFNKGNRHCQN